MTSYQDIVEPFIEMAHKIVWCSVATVDKKGRPRSRILHPIWEMEGDKLVGWIATGATPIKLAHLEASAFVSCNYWSAEQDTCMAECAAAWVADDATKAAVWDKLANAPAPLGYDPAIVPGWEDSTSPSFSALRLEPWRIRVMPAAAMLTGEGMLLWHS
ncbi:MAG: pyridoxamine 5'-phosphate oxidase family protein [Gammaproteobacteria bacterium]|nr:pyridoxamine 5'-phosphate oxidase family protein [Gammaproteobacteria bacterium]